MAYIGAEPVPGQNREVDDISSGFNGSATAFTLQVSSSNVSPESANNILVNLGGVLQNPGTDYTIAASTITFTTAPAAGLSFFGLILGAGINTATVADDTIGASKLIDTAVTAGSYTTADITVDAQGRITAAANGTISGAEIADQAVTNAKVNNSAAIAGTKISPDFGSQNIVTTGSISGAAGTFTGDVSIADTIVHTGDTNTKIRFPAADTVTVETAGSERMRIDSSGRMLIGTAVDNSFKFKVSDGGGFEFAMLPNDSGVNNFTNFDRANNVYAPLSTNASEHRFGISGTEKMRIDSSGRVGIGTTSPSNLLHLKGSGHDKVLVESTGTAHSVGVQMTHASGNAAEQVWQLQTNAGASTQRDLSVRDATAGTFIATFRKGGGITFNGDTAAANALDDYEEGIFTPQFAGVGGGPSSISFNFNGGNYVKIGELVFVSGRSEITASSGGSQHWLITNLPFNLKANDKKFSTVGHIALENFSIPDDVIDLVGVMDSGNNNMLFSGTRKDNTLSVGISHGNDQVYNVQFAICYRAN